MADSTTIKVHSNLCDNMIFFDTVEDFEKYYNKHKDEVDAMATRGLNQKFKIKDFKIGRRKGVIMVYPIKTYYDDEEEFDPIPPLEALVDGDGISIDSKLNSLNEQVNRALSHFTRNENEDNLSIHEKLNRLNEQMAKMAQIVMKIYQGLFQYQN